MNLFDPSQKTFYIKETKQTPRLILDANRKIIDIRGPVLIDINDPFFVDISSWINAHNESLKEDLNINAAFEYFNTYCSKAILDLFKQAESFAKRSKGIKITWVHEEDDLDMLEAGEDYEAIINVPFNFIKINEPLLKDDIYYATTLDEAKSQRAQPIIIDFNQELLKYIAKYPDFINKITSRKFEELIADILKDLGFDVELTKITRDGGRDIVAHIKNNLTSIMMFIECKHYAPHRPVGVDIIREVIGVKEIYKPNKSLIVTSSYFTKDAIKERDLIASQLDLKDHNDIKNWLQKYK